MMRFLKPTVPHPRNLAGPPSHDSVQLSGEQIQLIESFRRRMPVLCMAGAWCGDCVAQCPIFQRIAAASELIDLRFIDRDADADLAEELKIAGGSRVPQLVFMSEEFLPVSRAGDRTLARYREMASTVDGAMCSTGIVMEGDSVFTSVVQEWLDEFERCQHILRLSPRLRKINND